MTEQADMSVPMYWDRLDTPLPDKPYQDTLSDADKSLKQKEKGPWNNLSKEEKLACWYTTSLLSVLLLVLCLTLLYLYSKVNEHIENKLYVTFHL